MRLNSESEALPRDRILQLLTTFPIDLLKIYPRSFCFKNELWYGLIRTAKAVKLAVLGTRSGVLSDPFQGDSYHQKYSLKICDLSKENTNCLMDLFAYTRPISLRSYSMTVGFGDQLGLAIPGILRAIRKFEARPVLTKFLEKESTEKNANRFIREPVWAIFQENYQEGYGTDRNHLNSLQDVKCALDSGASVITLDLSGKMNPDVFREPEELINRRFCEEIDEGDAKVILHLFLDKEFQFRGPEGNFSFRFDEQSVKRNTLFFQKALDFTEEVYEWIRIRTKNQATIDLGISLEKMPFPTSPEHHFFLALQLSHRGVHLQFLAPQIFGGFRNDVNFNEDQKASREQFYQHLLIAEDYGYKISIRGKNPSSLLSGIGGLANEFMHLRLPDLSWLEAMRLVTLFRPALYREMHSYSLSEFSQKSRLQHPLEQKPKLEELSDEGLSALLDQEDSREFIQIAFKDLLHAASQSGEYIFRNKLYETLNRYEEDYWSLLEASIERDLNALGVKKRTNRSTKN